MRHAGTALLQGLRLSKAGGVAPPEGPGWFRAGPGLALGWPWAGLAGPGLALGWPRVGWPWAGPGLAPGWLALDGLWEGWAGRPLLPGVEARP